MNTACVVGLGYIGLPTASILATHGFRVIGYDVNSNIVSRLREGHPHIKEPGLTSLVEEALTSGNLIPSTRPEEAAVFVIAVPTPVTSDKKVDLSHVISAAESLVPVLRRGCLVLLESTCPPGTTRDVLVPILARSGLDIGTEVRVAYCPERVLPGRIIQEVEENDRVIGGINGESAEAARQVYVTFVKGALHLTDATTAEMVKLTENTFRDVNIALANELGMMCEQLGINVWDVISKANLHPRVTVHQPGPGVGGHCIPVDPWFLVDRFPDIAQVIRTSRMVNDDQPHRVFQCVSEWIQDIADPKIAILGVSYKGNVDDARESPSRKLILLLEQHGFRVTAHDPLVENFVVELVDMDTALSQADCLVIMTDHDQYRHLDPSHAANLVRHRNVLDTRNMLDEALWNKAGFRVKLKGRGDRT